MSVLEKIRKIHARNGRKVAIDDSRQPKSLSKQDALAALGVSEFRAGQEEIIDEVIRSDAGTLAICPTGWGKSLIYQVAGLTSKGITLVVGPLISLMKDQVDKLQELGIPAALINSSLTRKQEQAVLDDMIAGNIKLLFVAPERFRNKEFQGALAGLSVGLFAVDEAHCISKWGHDFRPAYTALGGVVRKSKPRRVVALTATATPSVASDICEQLGIRGKRFVRGVYRPNLRLAVFSAPYSCRYGMIQAVVQDYAAKGGNTGIIYAPTRRETETICSYLKRKGLEAELYHAGMKQKKRNEVQAQWASEGGVIVATCAFGMGIDRPDVRFVLHSGLSPSVEDWYQEVGRAGWSTPEPRPKKAPGAAWSR